MYALQAKTGLKTAAISHMVSVLRQPLDRKLFEGYEHLVIEADDMDNENLIEHFPNTNAFISTALKNGGVVFVHCAMGKSRSATILAAYLMQSRQLDAQGAVQLIRQARHFVEPNAGFMEQLEIYHQMQYTANLADHPIYQRWLYKMEVKTSRAAPDPKKIHFRNEEKKIEEITGETPGQRIELRCRKCRTTLATSDFLALHVSKSAQAAKECCSHHFVEPMSWMRPEFEQSKLDGKFECPKCKSKVGSYDWSGIKCSCGEWVNPGISLARSKVDEVKVKV
ncbi:protein-tyrosine phosphatase-like protein [Sphaerosporella brunnea]|uniref:protein-tyrosine-phosphatase n=1 Tax=Sphaerosporella brunnea TaxID=1250544 RepID=A0A5J5ECQ7_9PEZI|nr:protein-tyrosine phosphatase-like protein [Sphaerosporella brunnea]